MLLVGDAEERVDAGARALGPGRVRVARAGRARRARPAARRSGSRRSPGPRDAVDTLRRARSTSPDAGGARARCRSTRAERSRSSRRSARSSACRARDGAGARARAARRRWRCAARGARAAPCACSWTRRTSDERRRPSCFDLGQVLVRWDPYRPFVGRMARRGRRTRSSTTSTSRRSTTTRTPGAPGPTPGPRWPRALPQHAAGARPLRRALRRHAGRPGPGLGRSWCVTCVDGRCPDARPHQLVGGDVPPAEPAAPAIGLLEDVLVSGEVGLAKPDPRIFALLIDRFGLRPGPHACSPTTPLDERRRRRGGSACRPSCSRTAEALRADLRRARGRAAAHLGSTPCDCSSPEPPRPRCRRSRPSSAPATRWSRCSPAPTPGRGAGAASAPSAVKARAAGGRPRGAHPGQARATTTSSARLAELAVDAAPVVAYGALIPPSLLDVPTHGWVNLHFSVLPAWRGAAPVQHAIIAGDEVTGASTFRLEEGLDTGPVLGFLTETIRPRDTVRRPAGPAGGRRRRAAGADARRASRTGS